MPPRWLGSWGPRCVPKSWATALGSFKGRNWWLWELGSSEQDVCPAELVVGCPGGVVGGGCCFELWGVRSLPGEETPCARGWAEMLLVGELWGSVRP